MKKWLVYLKQITWMVRKNPFYCLVYVLGSGLAIAMVMTIAVVYHIRMANIPPETHRDRTVYQERMIYRYSNDRGSMGNYLGLRYLKQVLLPLKTPEAVAIMIPSSSVSYAGYYYIAEVIGRSEPVETDFMLCNADFWKVYEFEFLSGKPFGEADVESGFNRVVICQSLARELFGTDQVEGQTLWLNEKEYTVTGVVADVSATLSHVYAQLWLPYTVSPAFSNLAVDECNGTVGSFQASILLRDRGDMPKFQAELEEATRRYNASLVEGKAEPGPASFLNFTIFGVNPEKMYGVIALFLALFFLVPALNIAGLNASHVQGRLSEIGIRRAFGAKRGVLFMEIFWENLLLMLPGGLVGLLLSYGLVYWYRDILLLPGVYGALTSTAEKVTLTPGMLFNGWIFVLAFIACLALNLLSSLIPIRQAVKSPITDSLNMSNI